MVRTMKNKRSLLRRPGWIAGAPLLVLGIVSVALRVSPGPKLYLIDLHDGSPTIQGSPVDDESHFSESNSYVYVKLDALGSEMRGWMKRIFERDTENAPSPLTSPELRAWAEKQTEKNPEFAIIVMARIPKKGNLDSCPVPEVCRLALWVASAHLQSISTATNGNLSACFSGTTLKISGRVTLRFTPPGISEVSSVDSERLEFEGISINPGPDLLEFWKRKLLPFHAISEIQSWVDEDGRAN
jgi:hypothetical protein